MPTLINNFTKEQSKQVKGTTKSRFDDGGGDISLGSDFLDRRLEAYINATVLRPWRTLCCCYGIIIIVIFLGIFASGLIMSPSGYYEWSVTPRTNLTQKLASLHISFVKRNLKFSPKS